MLKNIESEKIISGLNFATTILNFGFKIFTLIGIIMLIIYFNSINFIPIGNFQSLAYIIILIAVMGILLGFSVVFTFFLAPFIWLQLIKLNDCFILIFGIKQIRYKKTNYIDWSPGLQIKNCLYYLIFAYGSMLLFYFSFKFLNGWPLIILFYLAFLGISRAVKYSLSKSEKIRKSKIRYVSAYFKIFTSILGSGFLLFLSCLFILRKLYYTIPNADKSFTLLIISSIMIVIFSSITLVPPKSKIWNMNLWAICASIGSIIIIFYTLGVFSSYTGLVVRNYNLGAMENTSIFVDEIGCKILAESKYPVVCNNQGIYSIKNINILWRVGEYYISFKKDKDTEARVLISGEHVPSFTKEIELKKN